MPKIHSIRRLEVTFFGPDQKKSLPTSGGSEMIYGESGEGIGVPERYLTPMLVQTNVGVRYPIEKTG